MKAVIATHVYTTGPAQDLRDYFINQKIDDLLFIGHPLFYDKKLNGSGFEVYRSGKKISEKYQTITKSPEIISYLKDIFLNIYYVIKFREKYDLYVGSDNLNAFSGIILKKLGYVDKVVYYVIDYNPYRFTNPLLNSIYHKIDQICVKYSDETWNLSPRMEWGRKKYFGFSGGNQKVVPVGVWSDRINLNVKKIPNSLVFMGHITKKQGIQEVLKVIPKIVKKIPSFKFFILGGGDYLDNLIKLSKSLNISKNVEFKGYIDNHQEIEKLLPRYSLAIAPYEKYDDNGHLSFTYFADPAKIKLYLACGLPILVSNVPYIAKEIKTKCSGAIIGKHLSTQIVNLLKDNKTNQKMISAAIAQSTVNNWENIFSNILNNKINK